MNHFEGELSKSKVSLKKKTRTKMVPGKLSRKRQIIFWVERKIDARKMI